MYKEEVFKMANGPIQKYHEINSLIERQQRENEMKAKEAKDLKMSVDELKEKLPQLRAEHKELSKRNASQEEASQKLKESCHELAEKLKHLQDQKRSLLKRVVSDEESRELQKQIENLKSDIANHKELGSVSEGTLRELNDNVELMNNLKKDIEKAEEIIPMRLIDQLSESKKQLEKAMTEEHSAQEKQTLLQQLIEEEQQNYEALEQQYTVKKKEFESKEKQHKNQLESLKHVLKQKNDKFAQMQREDHALDCQLEEQRDIAEYLKENINEILATYEGNNIK